MPGNERSMKRLQTSRHAGGETRIVESPHADPPGEGEVLMRLERFGLTTNNISYTAFGDTELKYWDFFPTGDPDWGHMPVWGIAEVSASSIGGVAVGERFYGYYPIAAAIRMRPDRVTPRGFIDAMPHRKALVSAYNHYTRCSADPGFSGEHADYQMLLRPLFITSFVLADFLRDQGFFGASRVVVSSASSKTAFGTASCLRGAADIEVVALTSARNRGFVESLGCYARALDYDAVESLSRDVPTVYLDFSGDGALRSRIHAHLGSSLVYDCSAGWAQTPRLADAESIPGPQPVFFFAPEQIRKRNADWGPQVFAERFGGALLAFIDWISHQGPPSMTLVERHGFDAAQRTIAELHAGSTDPRGAYVVSLASLSP